MKGRPSGQAAREAAHDLNNLLTAIIGAADAVLQRSAADPETRADIAHIREGARRGALMVRRLAGDPGEIAAGLKIISVNETIHATSRLLDHRLGPNIALVLDFAEPGHAVLADPSQLDRVLLNLAANAGHAMPNGGTVTLGTAWCVLGAAKTLVPDTIPAGDYVVLSMTDTGSGVPADQMSRIFETGISSRKAAGGTGLGLASVRDIVRQSHGFLSVVSVEGRGSRFEIYLPRVANEPTVAASVSASRAVLLVEDDVLVRRVMERALHRAGWDVLRAGSAEEALEILEVSACDLMISDVLMPGMDGMALARLVLARWPALPVILTSGYAHPAAEEGFGLGNVVFLLKPYGHDDLLGAIERVAK